MSDTQFDWSGYVQALAIVESLHPYTEMVREVVTAAQIDSTSTVLDVGCGRGALLSGLEAMWAFADVVGVDQVEEMLAAAKRRPYSGRASFLQLDLNDDHWPQFDQRFTHIVSINVFYALADPTAVLCRLAATASPGTTLVISTPHDRPDPDAIEDRHFELVRLHGLDLEEEAIEFDRRTKRLRELVSELLRDPKHHYPDEASLRGWFDATPWKIQSLGRCYADQNWLVTARRDQL